MTRKDYKLIAEALSGADVLNRSIKFTVAEALADALGKDNTRFKKYKFIEECMKEPWSA